MTASEPSMPCTHAITRRIQFAETDLAGVLHFSNYFRLMEEVEHAFFREIGLGVVIERNGATYSWPRVSVGCEYAGPLRFEDVVTLEMTITRVGTKSFDYEVAFLRDGRRLARGRTTAVCCRMKSSTFESIEIPDFLRAPIEGAIARDTPHKNTTADASASALGGTE